MPAADLARIADRLPLLASGSTVRAAMARVRSPMRREVIAQIDRKLRKRSGKLRRSVFVSVSSRGLTVRVKAYYARFHEYGTKRLPRRAFARPAVEAIAPDAATELAREIEGVAL